MFDIKEELKKLPENPGVYIMKNADEQIIYIGKAKVLKNRVRQYFQSSGGHTPKVVQMVKSIASFEIIVTGSELEALILECNLIKKHRPKYNILLRDDKHYPYIKVTVNEAFPKILSVRNIAKDKAKYFGPFSSMLSVKETVELCQKLFRLRTCHRSLPKDIGKKRPCLNYHIGRCSAPCDGKISQAEYGEHIKNILLFLEGKQTDIIRQLKEEMAAAAEEMAFERAAEIRDKIQSISAIFEKQKIDDNNGDDRDIVAFARAEGEAVVQIFFVRGGKMVGRENFLMIHTDDFSRQELMAEVLKQFYAGGAFIPSEIIVADEAEEAEIIEQWLTKIKGRRTVILCPKRGEKLLLAKMAQENAMMALNLRSEEMKREYRRATGAVAEIQEALGLAGELQRIEAYDISNIYGFESVGSMVAFENGKPKRSDYRKFRIRTVTGANDYASMVEVLTRRLSHGINELEELKQKGIGIEEGKFTKMPDLIMMDGGKIQVNAALEVLGRLNLNIPVCGMIKDDNHRTRGLIYENEEIKMKASSEGFKLLTRIQDEVHRFSIEYHRKLRDKTQVHSILDEIPGVGEARRKILMRSFESIDKIRAATVEELAGIDGIDKRTAESIARFFAEGAQAPQEQAERRERASIIEAME